MVMPQTYMRTWPGSSGTNGSSARLSELWMRRVMEETGSVRHAGAGPANGARRRPAKGWPRGGLGYNRGSISAGRRRAPQPPDPASEPHPRDTRPVPADRLRFRVRPLPWLLGIVLTASAVTARAAEAADIQALLRAGKAADAVKAADQALASKPKDASLRFLKGVALAEQQRPADAIAVFQKLTEDYPELPEPYNNLAVLHAAQGQYDRARTALEMAIRTNPSYATAYENLGDVYAKLASQAYSKALQVDGGNTAAAPKLDLIRELFAGRGAKATGGVPATVLDSDAAGHRAGTGT